MRLQGANPVVKNNQIGGDRLRVFRRMLLAACVGFAPLAISTEVVAQGAKSYVFAISEQSVSAALVRYSSVTGIDVAFDGPLPPNLRTAGFTGNLTAENALTRLWPAPALPIALRPQPRFS
jgi:iron complex outermembrane receptor protein